MYSKFWKAALLTRAMNFWKTNLKIVKAGKRAVKVFIMRRTLTKWKARYSGVLVDRSVDRGSVFDPIDGCTIAVKNSEITTIFELKDTGLINLGRNEALTEFTSDKLVYPDSAQIESDPSHLSELDGRNILYHRRIQKVSFAAWSRKTKLQSFTKSRHLIIAERKFHDWQIKYLQIQRKFYEADSFNDCSLKR